jgi:hypothetical protein
VRIGKVTKANFLASVLSKTESKEHHLPKNISTEESSMKIARLKNYLDDLNKQIGERPH